MNFEFVAIILTKGTARSTHIQFIAMSRRSTVASRNGGMIGLLQYADGHRVITSCVSTRRTKVRYVKGQASCSELPRHLTKGP